MRITCPNCGERSIDEFTAAGAAETARPEAGGTMAEWIDYVYVRANPAGRHAEWFHHISGCRAWLVVTRDTRTHDVISVVPAVTADLRRAQDASQ